MASKAARASHPLRTAVIAILGLLLITVTCTAPSNAHATTSFTYPDAITVTSITNSSQPSGAANHQGDFLRIDGIWSVTGKISVGETFGMKLPAEFTRLHPTFPVEDQNGDPIAMCELPAGAAPMLTCTFTPLVNDKSIQGGPLWVEVKAHESTESSTVNFTINGSTQNISLPNGGGIIGVVQAPGIEGAEKYAWIPGDAGSHGLPQFAWTIRLNSSLAVDGVLQITDTLATNSLGYEDHMLEATGFDVLWMDINPAGELSTHQHFLTPSDYSTDFTAGATSFTLTIPNVPAPADGYSREYRVEYRTVPTSTPLTGDVFGNTATVAGEPIRVRDHTYSASGGGSGLTAEKSTRFRISKAIIGEAAALVPDDAEFTVAYTANNVERELTFGIGDANAVSSERVVKNTPITISEINLPTVSGVTWSTVNLSGEGVLNNGDGTFTLTSDVAVVELILTNTATPSTVFPPADTPVDPPLTPLPELPTPATPLQADAVPATGHATLAHTGAVTLAPLAISTLVLLALGAYTMTRSARSQNNSAR